MTSAVSSYALYSSSSTDTAFGQYKMHPESDSSAADPAAFNYDGYSHYTHSNSSRTSSPTSSTSSKNDRSLTISTNAPMAKTSKKKSGAGSESTASMDENAKAAVDGSRPDHLKPRLCTVPGCKKRVRSKGLCKAHGGGRRCMVEGCERSSQGQGLCIRHGGGKRCTQTGCTKASQSNGLCKAHGGGLRCQAGNCTKSSQGGGFCRAHGGGQRCEKEGCNKGAQRGGFCAGHGGSRFCQHPDCTKNDRGGGYCAEHGGGKRCDQQGCNKPARKKGKCSYHANANKQKASKDMLSAAPSTMMDMRQITAPAYGSMAPLPKDVAVGLRDSIEPSTIRSYPPVSSYSRAEMDQRYSKGYDQPLPLPPNAASSQYLPMHGDQRGYEQLGLQQPPSRHYMQSMDSSSLPSVSSGYASSKHQATASMAMMDRNASAYGAASRDMMKSSIANPYSHHWSSKEALSDRASLNYFDMKDQTPAHHQPYGGASTAYHAHLSAADSVAAAAAAYGQRDSYYHHSSGAPTGDAPSTSSMMYYSSGYPSHQMHTMDLL